VGARTLRGPSLRLPTVWHDHFSKAPHGQVRTRSRLRATAATFRASLLDYCDEVVGSIFNIPKTAGCDPRTYFPGPMASNGGCRAPRVTRRNPRAIVHARARLSLGLRAHPVPRRPFEEVRALSEEVHTPSLSCMAGRTLESHVQPALQLGVQRRAVLGLLAHVRTVGGRCQCRRQ
jgi:hypothetical protein